jgi:YHS domain-containing protein
VDNEKMAIDPICKMTVDESSAAGTSTYNGNTYYFCNPMCKDTFDKKPEQYV